METAPEQTFVFSRHECGTRIVHLRDRQSLLRSRFLWITRNLMGMTSHITNLTDTRRMLKTAKICQWTEEKTKSSAENTLKAMRKFENADRDPGFVYLLRAGDYYKIGKTINPSSRIKTISLQMPFPVEVFAIIPSLDYARLETLLHNVFHSKNTNGEWFCLTDPDIEILYGFDSIFWLDQEIGDLLSGQHAHVMGDMQRIIENERR